MGQSLQIGTPTPRAQCPLWSESDRIDASQQSVAKCHKRKYALQQSDGYGSLLDHLVGSREKRWRDFQAERSGSHKIDDELELC